MGQQVIDDELGILGLVADMDGHHRAVGKRHHAVELQGNGDPVVLADAAVVMGLEIGQLRVLIQGPGLQIQAGCVGVGGGNDGALGQRFSADDGQHDSLATVVAVHLVAGLEGHAGLIRHKAPLLGQLDAVVHAQTLGLAVVQKVLVILAIGVHGGLFALRQAVIAVLRRVQQGLAQLAFAHG